MGLFHIQQKQTIFDFTTSSAALYYWFHNMYRCSSSYRVPWLPPSCIKCFSALQHYLLFLPLLSLLFVFLSCASPITSFFVVPWTFISYLITMERSLFNLYLFFFLLVYSIHARACVSVVCVFYAFPFNSFDKLFSLCHLFSTDIWDHQPQNVSVIFCFSPICNNKYLLLSALYYISSYFICLRHLIAT